MKRTTLPKRVLAPRRNVAELPISPWSKVESSGQSSTSSSLLSSYSSASSLSNSAVGAAAVASAVLTRSSKAMDRVPKGFRAPDSCVKKRGGSRAPRQKNWGSRAPRLYSRAPFGQNQHFSVGSK